MSNLKTIKNKSVQEIVKSIPSMVINIGISVIFVLFVLFFTIIHTVDIQRKIDINAKIIVKDTIITAYVLFPYNDKVTQKSPSNNFIKFKLNQEEDNEITASMDFCHKEIYIEDGDVYWYIPLYDLTPQPNITFKNGSISATSEYLSSKTSIFEWLYSLIFNLYGI